MTKKSQSKIENIFELLLWKSRLIVLLAVVFSLLAAGCLFVAGSAEIIDTIKHLFPNGTYTPNTKTLLVGIIGSIDLYLIGIVLLIFAFGVYELFISKIDIAHTNEELNILEITSLDELKNKLLKVIVMVLIVTFFKAIFSIPYETPMDMLYFALAILGVAGSTSFIRHIEKEKGK